MPLDPMSALVSIWNKVKQPLPEVLFGGAWLLKAPVEWEWEWRWLGWLPIAIGMGIILQTLVCHIYNKWILTKKTKNSLMRLSNSEKKQLDPPVICQTDTLFINEIDDFKNAQEALIALEKKGILTRTYPQDSYEITPLAYKLLRKLITKKKDYFSQKTFLRGTQTIKIIGGDPPEKTK